VALEKMEHNAAFIGRLIEVVEKDVVPLTDDATKVGNKVFGAAVLNKSDLSLVVAGTNLEMEWPLLHGEMSCLRNMQVRSPLPSLPPSSLVLSHDKNFYNAGEKGREERLHTCTPTSPLPHVHRHPTKPNHQLTRRKCVRAHTDLEV